VDVDVDVVVDMDVNIVGDMDVDIVGDMDMDVVIFADEKPHDDLCLLRQ
jgi:hypothetical protein